MITPPLAFVLNLALLQSSKASPFSSQAPAKIPLPMKSGSRPTCRR